MPNWCDGTVQVAGKTEDVEEFCKHFIFSEEANKGIKKQYFARSFIEESWESFKRNTLGKDTASFNVNFAWSAHSCLVEGYPDGKECITLMDACKKHKVNVDIDTEEPGMCFEEHIACTDEGELIKEDCNNMPEYTCVKCGTNASIPTEYPIDEYECWECNTTGNWKAKPEAKSG